MGVLILLLIILLIAILLKVSVKKYKEYERGIILFLGKFSRVVGPGWVFLIPFLEREYKRVDIRTKMIQFDIPIAFTKDKAILKIKGVLYYRIRDPKKAVLDVENYANALRDLIVSETRDTVAALSLDEVLSNIYKLNEFLYDRVRHLAWKWGIYVENVQLTSVAPSQKLAEALQSVKIAEQELLAQNFLANARKIVMEAIGDAAKKLDDKALLYLYIQALKELGQSKSVKILFPMRFLDVLSSTDIEKNLKAINTWEAIQAIKKVLEKKAK